MRLLDTKTLRFRLFVGRNLPKYAILSHTWRDEEIVFEDVRDGPSALMALLKKGLRKLLDSCGMARRAGYDLIWIDTCCIDKSSSAELSEAINSMFSWYEKADVCFAYLDDYHSDQEPAVGTGDDQSQTEHVAKCYWFTRGWTLQELLAPRDVHFFNADWKFIGNRYSLARWISNETGIYQDILRRHLRDNCGLPEQLRTPDYISVAPGQNCCDGADRSIRQMLNSLGISTRMRWAAERHTTRLEDVAYCLMGIFDVNMPLLYGEGEKAFQRLQEAIVNMPCDQTILAWESPTGPFRPGDFAISPSRDTGERPVFAEHPKRFKAGSLPPLHPDRGLHAGVYLAGSHVELEVGLGRCVLQQRRKGRAIEYPHEHSLFKDYAFLHYAVLAAHVVGDPLAPVVILLRKQNGTERTFFRRSLGPQMVFELKATEPARNGKALRRYILPDPADARRKLVFHIDSVKKVWIRLVTTQYLERERIRADRYPPLKIRYGSGTDNYSLSHPLPTIFQLGQHVSPADAPNWGLLCFTSGGYVRFFVCWKSYQRESVSVMGCSLHSAEEMLGTTDPVRGEDVPASAAQFYMKARVLATDISVAPGDRSNHPSSTKIRDSDGSMRHIGVKVNRLSFLGRHCDEILIEEVSEDTVTSGLEKSALEQSATAADDEIAGDTTSRTSSSDVSFESQDIADELLDYNRF